MVTRYLIADQFSPQFDHFRQVEVVPLDPAVIHPFEARIEAATDVDDNPRRVMGQELPRVVVQLSTAKQDGDAVVPTQLELPTRRTTRRVAVRPNATALSSLSKASGRLDSRART